MPEGPEPSLALKTSIPCSRVHGSLSRISIFPFHGHKRIKAAAMDVMFTFRGDHPIPMLWNMDLDMCRRHQTKLSGCGSCSTIHGLRGDGRVPIWPLHCSSIHDVLSFDHLRILGSQSPRVVVLLRFSDQRSKCPAAVYYSTYFHLTTILQVERSSYVVAWAVCTTSASSPSSNPLSHIQ
jgi:hypothetical protein